MHLHKIEVECIQNNEPNDSQLNLQVLNIRGDSLSSRGNQSEQITTQGNDRTVSYRILNQIDYILSLLSSMP